MKQCEKWLNTESFGTVTEDVVARKGWREALLWFYKTAEHLSPSDCDLIDEELSDDETKKD